ncbi:hypothetical protein A3D71_02100 [Candidatus Kaiserbacteria bacterium RIFCSPHIGHO2_02_FULL_55_20]|uniref:Uncharacterized protein n=1 Tax=Candidatus Kaiserbacteria bacterium RIFCSPHIGHO2_02_FULL_55_20 TaxID=1798497 RepID=A0A1F6DX33_9BACT|nr:MAG: hypothetical protein A2680_02960 [Candidatus Kaiserbacteria bacterium RIFCSPHIGHO2_01_FULL_55_37]OGG65989.1 MAG: hypothetical protein A3D71_02100 [Candidatus Kaiserbacteria bacterium RIFCSPHIGHO2_02_FULL_55_20]
MSNGNMSSMPGSKQTWYAVGAVVVVALLAWVVISNGLLGSVTGNTDETATSTGVAGGTGGAGGTTATGAGKLPAGWPADAPALQSGAKITYSGAIDPKTKVTGPTVVYTGPGTAATAVTFFKSQFTKQGWTFRGQGNVLGSVQLTATKDTRRVTVTILEVSPGLLNVTVGVSKL